MIIETNVYTLWNDIRHIIFTDNTQIRESIEKKYDRKENQSRQWSTYKIIQEDV
jgi:hypothetical protein